MTEKGEAQEAAKSPEISALHGIVEKIPPPYRAEAFGACKWTAFLYKVMGENSRNPEEEWKGIEDILDQAISERKYYIDDETGHVRNVRSMSHGAIEITDYGRREDIKLEGRLRLINGQTMYGVEGSMNHIPDEYFDGLVNGEWFDAKHDRVIGSGITIWGQETRAAQTEADGIWIVRTNTGSQFLFAEPTIAERLINEQELFPEGYDYREREVTSAIRDTVDSGCGDSILDEIRTEMERGQLSEAETLGSVINLRDRVIVEVDKSADKERESPLAPLKVVQLIRKRLKNREAHWMI